MVCRRGFFNVAFSAGSVLKEFLPHLGHAFAKKYQPVSHQLAGGIESGASISMPTRYTTKELSPKTWPDFERLFSQGNGWDFCWCMHFQRVRSSSAHEKLPRPKRSVRNHREKQALVAAGRAHGILVYANGQPVGWCQYGPRDELPRIDFRRGYLDVAPQPTAGKIWRITCFVVMKSFRRQGVGSAALQAALAAIRKKGGGLVEAYPVLNWDDLRRSEIRRRGHAPSFGNVSTCGTVSMFQNQGFKLIAPIGPINVLMRRIV